MYVIEIQRFFWLSVDVHTLHINVLIFCLGGHISDTPCSVVHADVHIEHINC